MSTTRYPGQTRTARFSRRRSLASGAGRPARTALAKGPNTRKPDIRKNTSTPVSRWPDTSTTASRSTGDRQVRWNTNTAEGRHRSETVDGTHSTVGGVCLHGGSGMDMAPPDQIVPRHHQGGDGEHPGPVVQPEGEVGADVEPDRAPRSSNQRDQRDQRTSTGAPTSKARNPMPVAVAEPSPVGDERATA